MGKFIIRLLYGTVGIQMLNELLITYGISLRVGINLLNMLIVEFLGIPGIALLYALAATKTL